MKAHNILSSEILEKNLQSKRRATDRIFVWILIVQWVVAIILAVLISPLTWNGAVSSIHPHVWAAILVGGLINILPILMAGMAPGWWGTRQLITIAQMCWSALLIEITGGRIETHFHIFVSLAFLAFYLDWRLFPTATLLVAADHLVRGFLWPESVYGIANPEWWRFLEHAGWVSFEDVVLVMGCFRATQELKLSADQQASLEILNATIEEQVRERTAELLKSNEQLAEQMKLQTQMETELRQAHKLEAVGRLAAGVAHEINTPLQFVGDSVEFIREAIRDFIKVINKLKPVHGAVMGDRCALEAAKAVMELEEELEISYLVENVPQAFDLVVNGLGRVRTIVRSMKAFAHPDSKEMACIDLNQAIEDTLVISQNEYKYSAEVVTKLTPIPHLTCFVGELNQVILNIIVNAADAVGDVFKVSGKRGVITVETKQEDEFVSIFISDTGGGIPDEIKDRIFDPFFTTKEIGKGTGQGLAIGLAVVEKHKGQLTVDSKLGIGTTFHIRLPIHGPPISESLKEAA